MRNRTTGTAPRQPAHEELLREHVRLQRTLIARRGHRLVDAGLLTRDEIDQHLADLAAGGLDLAAFPVVSAWGRKLLPGAASRHRTEARSG